MPGLHALAGPAGPASAYLALPRLWGLLKVTAPNGIHLMNLAGEKVHPESLILLLQHRDDEIKSPCLLVRNDVIGGGLLQERQDDCQLGLGIDGDVLDGQ